MGVALLMMVALLYTSTRSSSGDVQEDIDEVEQDQGVKETIDEPAAAGLVAAPEGGE
jgi:hypothetical protein